MSKTFDEMVAMKRIASQRTRKDYNLMILARLQSLIEKYPDLRFNQLLYDTNIIPASNEDTFNKESQATWEDMNINI